MSAPKSLFDLILPTSMEYSHIKIDETVYPFSAPFYLDGYNLKGAQELVAQICEWLNITIGPCPRWSVSKSWGSDYDGIRMVFLFKTEGDAVAFKLRWT